MNYRETTRIKEIFEKCVFSISYKLDDEALMRCQNVIFRKLTEIGKLYNCDYEYRTIPTMHKEFNRGIAKATYKLEFLILENGVSVIFFSYGNKPYIITYKKCSKLLK